MITTTYYVNNEDAALFVCDLLTDLDHALQSITITKQEPSGDYYVNIVTDGSLVGTVRNWVQTSYGLRMIIL